MLAIFELKSRSCPERDKAASMAAAMGRIERPDSVLLLASSGEPIIEFAEAMGINATMKEITNPSEWLEMAE